MHPLLGLQKTDGDLCPVGDDFLFDGEMGTPLAGDLGKMGDTQYLVIVGKGRLC